MPRAERHTRALERRTDDEVVATDLRDPPHGRVHRGGSSLGERSLEGERVSLGNLLSSGPSCN